MLAAREFYRGTQQLLKDLEPLSVLGPPGFALGLHPGFTGMTGIDPVGVAF
jgi:hypothetical protein